MTGRNKGKSKALLELFTTAGRLKGERRKGWVLKLGIEHPESVADHSYRTALMAMVYSDLHGLDTGRVLKMALIHDLPEAIVGDSIPGERTRRQKLLLESGALKRILGDLPFEQRSEYLRIWREFNRGTSKEARLVRQVDKLEMAVQASEYNEVLGGKGTDEFFESAGSEIDDPDLAGMLPLLSGKIKRPPSA